MKKEFNLSEKIVDDLRGGGQLGLCIEDVKQFIKEILEEIDKKLIKAGVCKNIFEINIGTKSYAVKDAKVMLEKIEEVKQIIKQKSGDKLR